MNIEVTTSVDLDEEIEFFPYFAVEAVPEGTQISAKSPVFADFIAAHQTKSPIGLSLRWEKLGSIYRTDKAYFSWDGSAGLFLGPSDDESSSPNLLWLLHPKLKEGFDFIFPEPLSLNNLEDYFQSVCDELRDVYIEYLRGAKFSVNMKEKKKK